MLFHDQDHNNIKLKLLHIKRRLSLKLYIHWLFSNELRQVWDLESCKDALVPAGLPQWRGEEVLREGGLGALLRGAVENDAPALRGADVVAQDCIPRPFALELGAVGDAQRGALGLRKVNNG